jgi:virulence factor Mce-like protein
VKRVVAIGAVLLAASALVVFKTGASTDPNRTYRVRAIFENAFSVIPGEDVKVAGVKVGKVDSLDVTPDFKAAVVLAIEDPAYQDFRRDATCQVRPQSLIGEKFVECAPGSSAKPELGRVADGEKGAGQHLLPLANTSSPVDIDLIGDINRLPYRQRFAIIINEFGTALAGRGSDLNEAIHRANPALRDTDRVLAILAKQNRVLANLAVSSDRVLAPLADKRKRIAHFINAANETGTATAERSADIERTFRDFPGFLRELRPTLVQLGDFADQTTPMLQDLHTAAPDLSRFIVALGPFSKSATTSVVSLGKAAEIGRPAIVKSLPLTKQLASFAKNALPVSKNLDALTRSFDKTGGIERLMDYIFFQVTAINGFDGVSHYLRAALIANLCSAYALEPAGGCNSNFVSGGGSAKVRPSGDPGLDKLHAKLAAELGDGSDANGNNPKPIKKKKNDKPDPFKTLHELTDPHAVQQRHTTIRHGTGRAAPPGQGRYQPSPEDQALDYLLGGGG